VTHAALGGLIGQVAARRDAAPGERTAFVSGAAVVASLPDVDHVLEWAGAEPYLLYHRTATHSLLFCAAVIAIVALLASAQRTRRVAVVVAALLSHLGLDVLTPFGTGLLWPFSAQLTSLDILPIAAPWLVCLSVVGLAFVFLRARRDSTLARRTALLALAAVGAYLVLSAAVTARAARALPDARAELVVPDPWAPLSAVLFVREGASIAEYSVGPSGEPVLAQRTSIIREDTAELLAAPRIAMLTRRFRVPIASNGPGVVFIDDLSYDVVTRGAKPIRIVVPERRGAPVPDRARVEQRALGVQPFAWLAVVGTAWILGRRRRRAPAC